MRPLECHWKLPDGCFCCYCRPFPVGELDWPYIECMGLFHEIFEELDLPTQIDLVLGGLIDLGICLPLLALLLPVVEILVSKLVSLVGSLLRVRVQ